MKATNKKDQLETKRPSAENDDPSDDDILSLEPKALERRTLHVRTGLRAGQPGSIQGGHGGGG